MRILNIGGYLDGLRSIEFTLELNQMQVVSGIDKESALHYVAAGHWDCALIDFYLPRKESLVLLRELRALRPQLPIMTLGANEPTEVSVKLLSEGADDYLELSCHPQELVARIYALVRRYRDQHERVIDVGTLRIDRRSHEVFVRNQRLHLTRTEYRVLEFLALRRGMQVAREDIMACMYGDRKKPPQLNMVSVIVGQIRAKVAKRNGGIHYIKSAWKRGYMLHEPRVAHVG